MREYVPTYPNPGDDDRPAWEKKLRPLFSAAEDVEGEGARPSSLIRAHEMPDPGRGYALMLMRELSIANKRTVRELWPLPPDGLPARGRTKPNVSYKDLKGNVVPEAKTIEEKDEMKRRQVAAAAILTAAGALAACEANHDADAARPIAEASKALLNPTLASSGLSSASGSMQGQASGAKSEDSSLPAELKPFIAPGMQIRAVARGDINDDGLSDVVLVLESVADREKPRSVMVLVRNESGVLNKKSQNDKLVPCVNCGGLFGDPFGYAKIDKGVITFLMEGGGREHWWGEYTFKYYEDSKKLRLSEAKRGVVDNSTQIQKEKRYTTNDFGVIYFDDFDPSEIPDVKLP